MTAGTRRPSSAVAMSVLMVFMMVLFTGRAIAAGGSDTDVRVEGFPAAPAVAAHILKYNGVPPRYGKGREGGNLIADVARVMGKGEHDAGPTDFMGVPRVTRDDVTGEEVTNPAYWQAVLAFLEERSGKRLVMPPWVLQPEPEPAPFEADVTFSVCSWPACEPVTTGPDGEVVLDVGEASSVQIGITWTASAAVNNTSLQITGAGSGTVYSETLPEPGAGDGVTSGSSNVFTGLLAAVEDTWTVTFRIWHDEMPEREYTASFTLITKRGH